MDRYKVMDHTADLMIRSFGETLEECFANAGYALFDQTVDLSNVDLIQKVHFEISEEVIEDRLYSFLSELLFIEDCDNLILKEIKVSFEGQKIICNARGEHLDRSKHRTRSEIKAVTYHMLDIDTKTPSVTVIFDV